MNDSNGWTGSGYLHLMYSPQLQDQLGRARRSPGRLRPCDLRVERPAKGRVTPPRFESWHSNGDEVAWTDIVNASGPANVGMCQWSARGNHPVLNQAFLMQDGGDLFLCGNDYDWTIQR